MLAADSADWLDLPLRLQNKGYTVLAMPLRPDVSGETVLGDFEAMLQALAQVSDPGHLAVIGAETGADMALAGCAVDPLCDALVLLTPTDSTSPRTRSSATTRARSFWRLGRRHELWDRRVSARGGTRRGRL